jgi:hypothetical protein
MLNYHDSLKGKKIIIKGKAIPGTGHEDLWCCETTRLPHFL